jgi:hypothetical protein
MLSKIEGRGERECSRKLKIGITIAVTKLKTSAVMDKSVNSNEWTLPMMSRASWKTV